MTSELEKELNKGYKLKEAAKLLSVTPLASMPYIEQSNDEKLMYIILTGMLSIGILAVGMGLFVYGDKIIDKAKKVYNILKR